MKRSAASPVGVGVISVITVLLVLTLSLFAALSVATAQADLALDVLALVQKALPPAGQGKADGD